MTVTLVLGQMGRESVRQARETIVNILRGKEKLEKGTFLDQAKLLAARAELFPLKAVFGEEMFNETLEKTVQDLITERTLNIRFTDTAERIGRICGVLNEAYNPIEAYVQHFALIFGATDVGIHTDHHESIVEAVQNDFGVRLGKEK